MKKPFYVEVGGSRLGKSFWLGFGQRFAINSTWPKAKIEIYKDYITLNTWNYPIKFRKKDIISIEKYKVLFSKGIKINHSVKSEYPFVIFWSWNAEKLINKLKQTG